MSIHGGPPKTVTEFRLRSRVEYYAFKLLKEMSNPVIGIKVPNGDHSKAEGTTLQSEKFLTALTSDLHVSERMAVLKNLFDHIKRSECGYAVTEEPKPWKIPTVVVTIAPIAATAG